MRTQRIFGILVGLFLLVMGHAQTTAHPEVEALIRRAMEARQQARWQDALDHYKQAIDRARALNDRPGEASAWHNLGVAQILMQRPQQALESLQNALPLWRELGNRFGEANTLHNLGTAYADLGRARDALTAYEQALSLRRQLGHQEGVALTLQGIGTVYYAMRDLKTAQHFFEQARALYRERGNKQGEAESLRYLANILAVSGQWQKALAAYEDALAPFREANDPDGEATTVAGMGALFLNMGQPELALGYYQYVLELRQKGNNRREVITAQLGVGHIYATLGENEQAKQIYEQALSLSRELDDKRAEAATLIALATVEARLQPKNLTAAEALYRQAMLIATATDDKISQANAQQQLGALYARMNRFDDAVRHLQNALQLYRELDDRRGEMIALSNLGATYAQRGEKERAADYYEQAVNTAEAMRTALGGLTEGKLAFQEERAALYARYISVLLSLNRLEQAFAVAQKAKARALTDLLAAGRTNLAAYLSPEEREDERLLRYRLDRATQNLLTARADPNADPELVAQLREQAQEAERDWQAFMDRLYARYPVLTRQQGLRPATLEQIAQSLPPDAALLEYLLLQPAGATGPSYLLLFCLTNERGKPRLSAHLTPLSETPLAERTESFVLTCAVPNGDYEKEARAMYRLLIAPVESLIAGKKRLILCPDSTLWDVPFGALLTGKQEFLLQRHELTYAPSATVAMMLRELRKSPDRPRPTRELLIVANPQFGMLTLASANEDRPLTAGSRPLTTGSRPLTTGSRPLTTGSRPLTSGARPLTSGARPLTTGARPLTTGARPLTTGARPLTTGARDITGEWLAEAGIRITPLPGTEREAESIAKLFPDATLLTKADAQEATLKSLAAQYRYLHLATHGYFSDAAPLQSGVVLAEPPADANEDGILTARELMELPLSAEMVVLSACESARGRARPGEGAIGIVWALTVSGIPTQIQSQWKVSDESTAELMTRYYQALKAGKSPSAALREAALAVKSNTRFTHPYYWAPFICVGFLGE